MPLSSGPLGSSPRIVLASTSVAPGGTWRHVMDLAHELTRAGADVTLGLLPRATMLQAHSASVGLKWVPLHRTFGWSNVIWHVHLHDTFDRTAFAALAARRSLGISVITEHLPRTYASDERVEPQHTRTRGARIAKTAFKKAEFRLANAIIAVSAGSAQFLTERYSLRPGMVTTVYNGLGPSSEVDPPKRGVGPLDVVAVGNSGRQKGLDVLLEAARLSQAEWRLTIAGVGSEDRYIMKLASALPPERVTLLGWVDDPQRYLLQAHVACMPSRWESFPYAALEATRLSRPLVASRVDGLDEIVADGVTGLLVEPDRPAELANALDRLSRDPELVTKLGRAARAHTVRYTTSAMLDETLAVYARACAAKDSSDL
jgi:glycosyltransferase involved in cell wall biosynthesis